MPNYTETEKKMLETMLDYYNRIDEVEKSYSKGLITVAEKHTKLYDIFEQIKCELFNIAFDLHWNNLNTKE